MPATLLTLYEAYPKPTFLAGCFGYHCQPQAKLQFHWEAVCLRYESCGFKLAGVEGKDKIFYNIYIASCIQRVGSIRCA